MNAEPPSLLRMWLIYRDKMWTGAYLSWGGYIRERWGYSRTYAYNLAQAGRVIAILAPVLAQAVACAQGAKALVLAMAQRLPDSEGVCRPLAIHLRRGGDEQTVRAAWDLALQLAARDHRRAPTASQVREALAMLTSDPFIEVDADEPSPDLQLIQALHRKMRDLHYGERLITDAVEAITEVLASQPESPLRRPVRVGRMERGTPRRSPSLMRS